MSAPSRWCQVSGWLPERVTQDPKLETDLRQTYGKERLAVKFFGGNCFLAATRSMMSAADFDYTALIQAQKPRGVLAHEFLLGVEAEVRSVYDGLR